VAVVANDIGLAVAVLVVIVVPLSASPLVVAEL
jgi:hypothetical protein